MLHVIPIRAIVSLILLIFFFVLSSFPFLLFIVNFVTFVVHSFVALSRLFLAFYVTVMCISGPFIA